VKLWKGSSTWSCQVGEHTIGNAKTHHTSFNILPLELKITKYFFTVEFCWKVLFLYLNFFLFYNDIGMGDFIGWVDDIGVNEKLFWKVLSFRALGQWHKGPLICIVIMRYKSYLWKKGLPKQHIIKSIHYVWIMKPYWKTHFLMH
jgi:hypothetical protein